MADVKLIAETALGGYARDWSAARLREAAARDIVSVAAWRDGEAALRDLVKAKLGLDLAAPGRRTDHAGAASIWTGPSQWFLEGAPGFARSAMTALSGSGAMTDQSDSWAILQLEGAAAPECLARLSMLDLHDQAFTDGMAARTTMEHMGVMITRIGGAYELYAPRSYSVSFLHAVETAVDRVCG